MTISNRSLIAIALTTVLAGCNVDSDPTVPLPTNPEPLVPAPAEEITVQIGDTAVKAMKESLVITSNDEDDKIGYVEAFKGIKFAEAERFAHSDTVSLESLVEEDGYVHATDFSEVCPQLKETELDQSEDCLNLNIWRPVSNNTDRALPVYVFIHGGDFEYGSGSEPLIHGDTVVAQGASEGNPFIYVSFNYRLGLLGSVWVDDEEGGNFGIGDQKKALQWVHDNITVFGGDPQNVTLMGQGAGAMSVGLLQETGNKNVVSGTHFQKAIMQSNPYGYEYKSYFTAESDASSLDIDSLKNVDLEEIKTKQSKISGFSNKLVDWLVKGAVPTVIEKCASSFLCERFLPEDLPEIQSDSTSMASLLPFAPYIEGYKESGCFIKCNNRTGYNINSQPSDKGTTLPTVLGQNKKDAGTATMLPSLTFLIAPVLNNLMPMIENGEITEEDLKEIIDKELVHYKSEQDILDAYEDSWGYVNIDPSTIVDILKKLGLMPESAYEVIGQLYFGFENSEATKQILTYTDYQAFNESEFENALGNIDRFNKLMNDMIFSGPNRKVSEMGSETIMYNFEFKPSFNVWTHYTDKDGETDIFSLLKSIACLTGACNASELPFVFNKAYKLDGTEVHPTSKDQALMNHMSRLWFSDELFNHQYSSDIDNVLVISEDGDINEEEYWDQTFNPSEDARLYPGRLSGLEKQELINHYIN